MKAGKTFFFGFAGFILIAIITTSFGLPPIISTLVGYIGGLAFAYTAIKYGWISNIKSKT